MPADSTGSATAHRAARGLWGSWGPWEAPGTGSPAETLLGRLAGPRGLVRGPGSLARRTARTRTGAVPTVDSVRTAPVSAV